LLGAATIWSDKAADIATAHVLVGAMSLALGGMLSLISYAGLSLDHARKTLNAPRGFVPENMAPATPHFRTV
jgi:hypothetical protein